MEAGRRYLDITARQLAGSGQCIVEVAGEIDAGSAGPLEAVLEGQVAGGWSVVVDLGGVTFMDAAGVGVLVRAEEDARRAGLTLRVSNADGIVARVLRITGTERLLLVPPSP